MEILVSGTAARVVFIEGEEVSFVEADHPENYQTATPKDIPYLLAGAPDLVRIPDGTKEQAYKTLLDLWNKDRAMHMLDFLLDSKETEEIRIAAANALEVQLDIPSTNAHVLNTSFAIPFWDEVDAESAKQAASNAKNVLKLVSLLEQYQGHISRVRQEWESIEQTLFESLTHRSRFELRAKDIGAFKAFAFALENPDQIDNAVFECYMGLASEKNSRLIVREWTKFLTDIKESKKFDEITISATNLDVKEKFFGTVPSKDVSPHEIYRNVLKQQEGVRRQLADQNVPLARKFVNQLVVYQLQHGDPKFAAKTLCSLARDAKSFGRQSLQLEWVNRATEVAPQDAWAYGQAGDVYLSLYQFTEALQHYEKAGQFGDELFALVGKGRVEKESANYEAALETFDNVIERFPDYAEAHRAWAGKGEALRGMWRFDDALEVYEAAKTRFPDQSVVWCGHAATLRDLGQLDAAQQGYFDIKKRFPEEPYGHGGWADIFKVLGDFDSALTAYDDAIERFPGEPVPLSGKADTLSECGRFEEALEVCQVAMDKFPYDPSSFSVYGKVLKNAGRIDDAIAQYNGAISKFKFDMYLRTGLANCMKEQGKLEEALHEYDQIVRDFPHNMVGWSTRANLLKEFGHYDEAFKAYSRVLERRPSFVSAKVSMAAILVIQGKFPDALALLPTGIPRTKSDWIGHHIRGMIMLKTNKVEEAITHFTRGFLTVPFFREKKYYENALSLSKIIKSEFKEASKYAADGSGTIAKILEFHCYGETGQKEQAETIFRNLENVTAPVVVAVRDELAARIGILDTPRAHNDAWIISTETDLILAQAA